MLPTIRLIDNKPSEWLAHRFFVLGQYDMCLNVVNQILRRTPDNPEALSMKGQVLRSKGRIEEALGCFQSAANIDATNIRHNLEIAKCLFFLGRFQSSLSILNEIEGTDEGKIWEVYHLMGQNYAKLHKYDEAVEFFDSAIDADFRVESVLEELNVFESMHDTDAMRQLIDEALTHHPTNAVLRRRIAKFNLSQSNYKEAKDHYDFAANRDSADFQSVLLSGSIEQENQHQDKAIQLYRKAFVGLQNSPALWNNVSLCINARNRIEASIACCKKAVFYAPFEAIPLANAGLNYLELGLYCSAAVALKRSISLDTHNMTAVEGLAIALMNLNQCEKANKLFAKALSKNKTHRLLINYSLCLYKSKKYSEAKKYFKEFSSIIEEEPAYMNLYPYDDVLLPMFSKIKE